MNDSLPARAYRAFRFASEDRPFQAARVLLSALAATVALLPAGGAAQNGHDAVVAHVEAGADRYGEVAQRIWDLAEVGYQETESSALLRNLLADEGFRIDEGVAGMPTAFMASWGEGSPVVGILAEYDALPGITQD